MAYEPTHAPNTRNAASMFITFANDLIILSEYWSLHSRSPPLPQRHALEKMISLSRADTTSVSLNTPVKSSHEENNRYRTLF